MNVLFYLSGVVAIVATGLVVTRTSAMHALLYLVVSFLAVSLMFFSLGAPFIAALEVIVYAGAIMVLFIFAIMLLNVGTPTEEDRRERWSQGWAGPAILALILLAELVYAVVAGGPAAGTPAGQPAPIDPRQVGAALFNTYLIGVELASVLLLSSLVGAYHLGQGRQEEKILRRERVVEFKESAVRAGVPEAPGDERAVSPAETPVETLQAQKEP